MVLASHLLRYLSIVIVPAYFLCIDSEFLLPRPNIIGASSVGEPYDGQLSPAVRRGQGLK